MASNLFKITVVQHWLHNCWIDQEGKPCAKDMPGARFVKARKVKAGTPGATKVKKKSGKWYGRVPGNQQPVPLSANKVAAQQILAELVRKAEVGRAGISDPFEDHRKRPLLEHLADFEADLKAKGNTPKQVRLKIGRIRRLLEGCRFVFLADLSASRVQQYLADLRESGRPLPPLDAEKEWFTRSELAAALGVKSATVCTLVRRHGLEAVGKGKARQFPRSTVVALQERLGRGAGIQTANYYLREVKAFCRWLVKDRRTGDNPLAHMQGGNVATDLRRARRSLSLEELTRLFHVARTSQQFFRGLSGADRAMIYATAGGTGFREGELASLLPEWFCLDGEPPTVSLPARRGKNRKPVAQPLPSDLVEALRDYLANRSPGQPVWPGTWAERGADMLRIDLEPAGIPYVIEGPDGPLYADFHSLRHSYVSLLDQSGVSLKQAMQLARHSDPKLTMARYGRAQLHDLGAAVERLPALLPKTGPKNEAVRATGTDPVCTPVCTGFVQTNDTRGDHLRLSEALKDERSEKANQPQPLDLQGVESGCDRLITV
ncbi:MAG TPA: tyrosine-type recombinase/integrase [Gemmataceae bacterium]|nr:tyrosine-type recombinase/integrase [Gemmataceae bacterium]